MFLDLFKEFLLITGFGILIKISSIMARFFHIMDNHEFLKRTNFSPVIVDL